MWKGSEPYPREELPTDRACWLIRKAAAQACYGSLSAPEPFLELNRSLIAKIAK